MGGEYATITKTKDAQVVMGYPGDCDFLLPGRRGGLYPAEHGLCAAVRPTAVPGG
jgi:hypothetical protein